MRNTRKLLFTFFAVALLSVIVIAGVFVARTMIKDRTDKNESGAGYEDIIEEEKSGFVNMANPYVKCDSLEEASEKTGFEIEAPDSMEGYDNTQIQVISDNVIEVMFYNGDLETADGIERVMLRKGTGEYDVSGDYNEYSNTENIDVDGKNVDVSGNDDLDYKAVWNLDGYSYSVCADEGLSREVMTELVKELK